MQQANLTLLGGNMLRAFGHRVTMCCDLLDVVGSCLTMVVFFTQQIATRCNTITKRAQHVTPKNVAICCVGMLQSFSRGFIFLSGRKNYSISPEGFPRILKMTRVHDCHRGGPPNFRGSSDAKSENWVDSELVSFEIGYFERLFVISSKNLGSPFFLMPLHTFLIHQSLIASKNYRHFYKSAQYDSRSTTSELSYMAQIKVAGKA